MHAACPANRRFPVSTHAVHTRRWRIVPPLVPHDLLVQRKLPHGTREMEGNALVRQRGIRGSIDERAVVNEVGAPHFILLTF